MKAILSGTTLKISAETEQEGQDLKVWLKKNIGREGDMEFDTLPTLYSRDMDEIQHEITGSRVSRECMDLPYDMQGLGFDEPINLSGRAIVAREESHKLADHYVISSGACETKDDAIKEFWEDYQRKGPYGDGEIFWRRLPEMFKEGDFNYGTDSYYLRCRFSIAKP